MEGAEDGFATASGMSAVFASMVALLLQAGDHIIASRAVFGSTHQILTQILPKWGITHTYVEPDAPETWESALQSNSKMLILESPANPGLALVDLEFAGLFAQKHDLVSERRQLFHYSLFAKPHPVRCKPRGSLRHQMDGRPGKGSRWGSGRGGEI